MTDHIKPEDLGVTLISEESVFGTTGTEIRLHPVVGSVDVTREQTQIDITPLRQRPWDLQGIVSGFERGMAKLRHYLQPPATRLDAAATSAAHNDTNNPIAVLLRTLFGALQVDLGSDVVTGASASQFDVTATHGSRFPAGALIMVQDGATASDLVPARVTVRSTDTITIYPSLSGTPSAGRDVVNCLTFSPSRTNTRSLSLAVAASQNSADQIRMNGGTGSLELTFEREGLASCAADLTFANHTGPSALSISTASAADPAAPPVACRVCTCLLQATTTTTRTNYPIDKATIKLTLGNKHLETLTGGTEGLRGVVRTEGITGPFAEIEVEGQFDTGLDTFHTSQTNLAFMLWAQIDTTGGRRMVIFDAPLCRIYGVPKHIAGGDGLRKTRITLRTYLDTSVTGTTELAEAPFRLGLGG